MVGSVPFWASMGMHGGQGLALAIPDVTPPTVVAFSPADNSTGVSPGTNMAATMSEVVVLGAAGIISLKRTSDNSVIQTWNVATQAGTGAGQVSVVGGTDLTMRLTSPLADTTEYYVIWDAGVVKDTSGNNVAALSVTTTWSFTSGVGADVTAPTVITFSPLDNATGVSITTDMIATMSEAVTLGTSGVITIKRSSDNSVVQTWDVVANAGSGAGQVNVVSGSQLTMRLSISAGLTDAWLWSDGVSGELWSDGSTVIGVETP